MTMLSAMRASLIKVLIIGLCALALSGCSALRIGYNQGPTLAWWWLDSYLDFDDQQAPRVKAALQRWFDWHRATQLPEYARLLADAQVQMLQPVTAAQLCRWNDELRARVDVALVQALPAAAELAPTLSVAQLAHLERKYRDSNEAFTADFLQDGADDRLKASVKRAVERAETLYGRIDERQRQLIASGVAASPFDAALWLGERQAVQAETLRTLRRLSAPGAAADPETARAALQALVQRVLQPQLPVYKAYRQRLTDYNCALSAQLHNSTTPAQRQAARNKLKGWEDDLRALAAQPAARDL